MTINVKVTRGTPQRVTSSTVFVGAGDYGTQITTAVLTANAAEELANSASSTANTAYEFAISVSNGNIVIVDAGSF